MTDIVYDHGFMYLLLDELIGFGIVLSFHRLNKVIFVHHGTDHVAVTGVSTTPFVGTDSPTFSHVGA